MLGPSDSQLLHLPRHHVDIATSPCIDNVEVREPLILAASWHGGGDR